MEGCCRQQLSSAYFGHSLKSVLEAVRANHEGKIAWMEMKECVDRLEGPVDSLSTPGYLEKESTCPSAVVVSLVDWAGWELRGDQMCVDFWRCDRRELGREVRRGNIIVSKADEVHIWWARLAAEPHQQKCRLWYIGSPKLSRLLATGVEGTR